MPRSKSDVYYSDVYYLVRLKQMVGGPSKAFGLVDGPCLSSHLLLVKGVIKSDKI